MKKNQTSWFHHNKRKMNPMNISLIKNMFLNIKKKFKHDDSITTNVNESHEYIIDLKHFFEYEKTQIKHVDSITTNVNESYEYTIDFKNVFEIEH